MKSKLIGRAGIICAYKKGKVEWGWFINRSYWNLALLEKQGWRLIQNPSSLAAPSLKEKGLKRRRNSVSQNSFYWSFSKTLGLWLIDSRKQSSYAGKREGSVKSSRLTGKRKKQYRRIYSVLKALYPIAAYGLPSSVKVIDVLKLEEKP